MITIRHATKSDQTDIKKIVRSSSINPLGLKWQNFIVAVHETDEVIGTAQLKPHNGIVELASIAVVRPYRKRGIARMLIEHLLDDAPSPLWLMCGSRLEKLYSKFGFVAVTDRKQMPRYFGRMQTLVSIITRFTRQSETLSIMVRYAPNT